MPPIVLESSWQGQHNRDLPASRDRLLRGSSYRDCSTICVVPTRGAIPALVVQSWMALMVPMNQKFARLFVAGVEVGEAYTAALTTILDHPELRTWRYMLTLEEDNMPPPDGLLRLIESIEGGVDGHKYDAVGGLYWTKGPGGQPMIYGNPAEMPLSFRPQLPVPQSIQPCNGLGMGFTLFRLSMFADAKLRKPWFKTIQEHVPHVGTKMYTQDLAFFEDALRCGHRVACDTRVLVGHYDTNEGIVW